MAFSACSLTYEQEQLDPTDHLHFRSHQVHASHTRTLFWIFSLVETKSLNAERQMATHLWVKADWYRGVCESDEEHHSSKKPYRQRPVIFLLHLVLPARIFPCGSASNEPKVCGNSNIPSPCQMLFQTPNRNRHGTCATRHELSRCLLSILHLLPVSVRVSINSNTS